MIEFLRAAKEHQGVLAVFFFVWVLGLGLAVFLMPGPISGRIGVALLFLLVEILWLKQNFTETGTATNSRGEQITVSSLRIAFGRPIAAVGPGLHFRWWPFEYFKQFPTGQYELRYVFPNVYSGAVSAGRGRRAESIQTMQVDAILYFRWPRLDETYNFPARAVSQTVGQEPDEDAVSRIRWRRQDVFFLLSKAHFAFPFDPMSATSDQIRDFFEGTLRASIETTCAKHPHSFIRERKEAIQHLINRRILVQFGPFYDAGVPWECTEVALSFRLPEDTERAAMAPENAARNAEASVAEAQGRARSAPHDAIALKARLQALASQPGGSPQLAQILAAGGVAGAGMDMAQYRDFTVATAAQAVLAVLGQFAQGRQQAGQGIDIDALLAQVPNLTNEQVEALRKALGLT